MPVWVAPKTTPIVNWAAARIRNAAVSKGRSDKPATNDRCACVARAVGWIANNVPNVASNPAAASNAPDGLTSATSPPTRAGPSTNDASSAAPS